MHSSDMQKSRAEGWPEDTECTTVPVHREAARQQRFAVAAALCATAVLVVALLNRIRLAGPCTYNSFQRSAVCSQLSALPANIPDNTQILQCKNAVEMDDSLMRSLNRFNFSMLRQLRELQLIRCGVEEILSDTFSFLPHLRRLDLRHNRIGRLAENQFRGVTQLEYLLLSDNPLVELGPEAFHGLTIGHLELGNNPSLTDITDTAFLSSRVHSVVLRRCNLEALRRKAMYHLADSLRELVITNNARSLSIDTDLLDGFHLRRLVLSNDHLTNAQFLAYGDHDEIVLDNNDDIWTKTSRRAGGERKRTRKLSACNTSLTSLSEGVDAAIFADVEELILSGNEIQMVTANQLLPFHRLGILDLSYNKIEQLLGNFTTVPLRLDSFNLTHNRLETLPEATWRPLFERLKSAISLSGNRLHYNCELDWLSDDEYVLAADENTGWRQCTAPVITNTSLVVDKDEMYMLCIGESDPAPRLTWSADNDRPLGHVDPPATRRGLDQLTTTGYLHVTRLVNYTCSARNLVGQTRVTVDLAEMLRSSPDGWQLLRRRQASLDIVNTPFGFTFTLALIALLAYLLKQH